MPPQLWDVVIVGAGPAGAAAAAATLGSRPAARVLMLDKQRFPRDKPCGDGIAAEALDVLGTLGFDVDAVLRGYPPIDRLRLTAPGGSTVERRMARPVRTIPRHVFDERLVADVVARGVELQQRQVRTIEQHADEVLVDGCLRARVLVGADGAESVVRRLTVGTGSKAGGGRQVALAIRGYGSPLPGQGRTQWITMGGRNWPAYAWSFPIGDGTANVGYGELLDDRPLTRAVMLHRMSELLPGIDRPTRLRAHRLPLTPGRPRISDGRILLAGDALSLINPLSGEGIFYAVLSGAAAGLAAAAADGTAGAEYRRRLAGSLGPHLRSTDLAARLVRTPGLIDGGVRAAGRDQAVFDDLVSLALGDGRLTGRLLAGVVLRSVLHGSRAP